MRVVFDLDGTLADTTHRSKKYIDDRPEGTAIDWPAFFAECPDDKPLWPAVRTLRALHHGHRIEIWTGRSEIVRAQTVKWLREHGVPYSRLLMRGAADFTDDHLLKIQWAEQFGRPDLVFEDRDRVVEAWRAIGVTCFQVAPGPF